MTKEDIFEDYLENKCPICKQEMNSESFYSETTSGGKTMAMHFKCRLCASRYTIGLERSRHYIESEIEVDNYNHDST